MTELIAAHKQNLKNAQDEARRIANAMMLDLGRIKNAADFARMEVSTLVMRTARLVELQGVVLDQQARLRELAEEALREARG